MQHPRSRRPLAIVAALALVAAPGCGGDTVIEVSTTTGDAGTCGRNQIECGSHGCVDTRIHAGHCGACGDACAPGEVCVEGACSLSCGGGATKCGSACVTTANDPQHCGACGNACAPGQVCSAGVCSLVCAGGTANCDGACVTTASDPKHCGACGDACAPGAVCSSGACSLVCGPGTVSCGASCTNTSFDPANCGVCGNACPAAPNASPVCTGGACDYACAGPFLDCNGVGADGCEINAASSASSCGACGDACPPVANGTPACSNGVCGVGSCYSGFGDCDGDAANGCETDLQSTADHCGACGSACAAGASCMEGVCTSGPCPPSAVHYAGYCWVRTPTNTTTHAEACASIGKAPTDVYVTVVWDASALAALSGGFGATSVGAYECCANSMWCNAATMQCGTHNYHPNEYWNYGGYGVPDWTPVYTCVP